MICNSGGGIFRENIIVFCLADEIKVVLLHVRLSSLLRREDTTQRLQDSPVCIVYHRIFQHGQINLCRAF